MLFALRKQDVCRFYKEDFWGELSKEKDFAKRLNRNVFGRVRRSKTSNLSRYEVLKLDNKKFVRRRRLSKFAVKIYNFQKVRLYFTDMSEFSLRTFIMASLPKSGKKPSGNSIDSGTRLTDRLGLRLDHLLFLAGWGASLLHVRELIAKGVVLLNSHIPHRYDLIPSSGDTIRVRTSFRNSIARSMIKLRHRRMLNKHRINLVKINRYNLAWRNKIYWFKYKRKWFKRRKLLRMRFLRSKPMREFVKNYQDYKSRRVLTSAAGKRWKRFRFSNAFYPYPALRSKMSKVPLRFFNIPDVREGQAVSSTESLQYTWKVRLAQYLVRLVQSYYRTNPLGETTASPAAKGSGVPTPLDFALGPSLQMIAHLINSPVVSSDSENKVFNTFPIFDTTQFKGEEPHDFFELDKLAKQPILKVYSTKLADLANKISSFPDFSELKEKLYQGRVAKALHFRRTLNMLLADPNGTISHLPFFLRRKIFVRRMTYVLQRIKGLTALRSNDYRQYFYPPLEENEVVGKLRRFALKSDFQASAAISGFTQLVNAHRWLNASIDTLLGLLLTQLKLNKFSKLSAPKRRLCSGLIKLIFSRRIPSQELSQVTKLVGGVASFLFASKVKSQVDFRKVKGSNFIENFLARKNSKFRFPSDKELPVKKAIKFLNKKAGDLKTASQYLNADFDVDSNFYKPTREFRRRKRPIARVLRPLAKRFKRKARVTLLLRRFSNLIINYRMQSIYFLGFRRVRGIVRPFYYFPCKFSIRGLFRYFKDSRALKAISKIETLYVNKPDAPFNMPRIKIKPKS